MSNFRPVDRETGFLFPPSIDDWLPEKHLARFVVEVIDGLDLSGMTRSYRGSGSASYHPALLLGLLVCGYATGVFSSRKLERATWDSVAFRFIAGNEHPDHDTIATFRRRFLAEIEGLFVRVLVLAREMGLLKLGTVALDGTKIHANASRHSALSYEHAGKIEAQLKAEVAELMAKAEAADAADVPDGMSIPDELARASCRWRPAGSSNVSTPRPWWPRTAFWWSPWALFRRPTTSSRSRRCSTRSAHCRPDWAKSTLCWPTPATSATPTWRPARRQTSRR
jgi:transposase